MSASTLILSPAQAGASFVADIIATLERETIADIGNLSQSKFPLGDVRAAIAEYPSVAMSGDRLPDVLRKLGEGGELDGMVFVVVGSLATGEKTFEIIKALRDTGISRRRILGVINEPVFTPPYDVPAIKAFGVRMSLAGAQMAQEDLVFSFLPLAEIEHSEFGTLSSDVKALRAGQPMISDIVAPADGRGEEDLLSVWAAEAADPAIVARLAPEAQVALGQAVRAGMIAAEEI